MNYKTAQNFYNKIRNFPFLPFLFVRLHTREQPKYSFFYTVPGLISEEQCAVLGIKRDPEPDWYYGWEHYVIDEDSEAGQQLLSEPTFWHQQAYPSVHIYAPFDKQHEAYCEIIYPALAVCLFAGKPLPIPESWIQRGL